MSTFGSDKYPYGPSQVKISKADIAERIRALGIAKNFNASSLSKAVNIPRSTMQKYWSGDRMISCEYLYPISDILQVNPRWLVTGTGSTEPIAEFDPENAGDEDRLLQVFRNLSEKERDHIIETAELLSKTQAISDPQSGQLSSTVHSQKDRYKAPDTE